MITKRVTLGVKIEFYGDIQTIEGLHLSAVNWGALPIDHTLDTFPDMGLAWFTVPWSRFWHWRRLVEWNISRLSDETDPEFGLINTFLTKRVNSWLNSISDAR